MISAYSMKAGRVISILDVRDGRIASDAEFRCPRCHTPMFPAIGQVRRPHFRHRDLSLAGARGCSPEGILHSTAKLLIAERVAAAAAAGQPYPVRLAEAIACPHRRRVLGGKCRHRSAQRSLDLARLAPARVEAHRGPFRHDLLFEKKGKAPLAIEIAVSSPTTATKRAANTPMIEIRIENDEDIARLMQGIDDHVLSVDAYGMEPHLGPPTQVCAGEDCASRCLAFSVTTGGSVRLEEQRPFETCRPRIGRAYQVVIASRQAFALSRFEVLDRLTRQAYYRAQAPIRSCLICRHHEIADFSADGEGPIVCRNDGQRGSVNRGAGCLYLTPFATIDEARQNRLERHGEGVIEP